MPREGGMRGRDMRKISKEGGVKRTEAVVVMRVISDGPQDVRMRWVSHCYFQSCRRSPRFHCLHSRPRTIDADGETQRKAFQERLPRLWKLYELLHSSSQQRLLLPLGE